MLDPKPFLAVSVILALPAATLAQSCPSVGGGASLTYTAESVWSAQSSSVVAGGSKLKSVLMFRHISFSQGVSQAFVR